MMTRRDDNETHAKQRDDDKEKETYRSYDERSVILRGNKHNLCVCVFVGMLFFLKNIHVISLVCGSDKVWQFLVFRYLNDDIYDISL